MGRIASVLTPDLREAGDSGATRRLAAALLAGSPRVMVEGPGRCRADAGGWERRGGEEALARALLVAASRAGGRAGVGVADGPVAADAAARLALGDASGGAGEGKDRAPSEERVRIVPPGGSRAFLAPLPLDLLPLPDELRETLRALGFRRIGETAARDREELEARFGPAGLRLHRWATGEEERVLFPPPPEDAPEVRLELEDPVRTTEPLLFVLRRLLARLCADLAEEGWCAGRLLLRLTLEDGEEREVAVSPARPTRREGLLFDLFRAALEGRAGGGGRLSVPASAVALRVPRRAPAGVRQEDLFASGFRDPVAAAATLSRLRERLGEEAVVRPVPEPAGRPEDRGAWTPVTAEDGEPSGGSFRSGGEDPRGGGIGSGSGGPSGGDAVPGVLRLLPRPRRVGVREEGGRPAEVLEGGTGREVVAAEGPERLSGGWWTGTPWRREYFRVCTSAGELLWLFREVRGKGESRWMLHGWWD